MDMLLVTLQPSFAGYVAARLSTRSKPCRVGVLTEIATGIRKPALVVHALRALLLMAATGFAVVQGLGSEGHRPPRCAGGALRRLRGC